MKSKQLLRNQMLKRRQALTDDHKDSAEISLFEQITAHKAWQEAVHIGCYIAVGHELGTRLVIQAAWAQGKHVYVPVIEPGMQLLFVEYRPEDTCQNHAVYGVVEPVCKRQDDSQKIEFLVVPAVGIDVSGHRLGYGKGYYDRFLKKKGKALYAVGVAYDCCRLDTICPQLHDQVLDEVIFAETGSLQGSLAGIFEQRPRGVVLG